MRPSWAVKFWNSLSLAGLVIGTLLFAASLTPTLIPRTYMTQGVLSGCCFAAGYGVGVFSRWLWSYMQLPSPNERRLRVARLAASAICLLVVAVSLWKASGWQNSIRTLMALEPVDTAHPLEVGLIALLTFALLIVLARLFRLTLGFVAGKLRRFVPERISNVLGTAAAVVLFWSIADGIFFRLALRAADSSFRQMDDLVEPEAPQPEDPAKTGSAASLIRWDDLGRMGRSFVATAPTREALSSFSGRDAMEPIRVYAGLNSADTPEARARLALQELLRTGAFDRSVLIVVTPTGTGWVDPAGIDTVEYLHRGDIASVAIQYSYLPSWMSLLTEPGYGAGAARALFQEVYRHWTALPRDKRPRLYLYGLSLGALSSEQSAQLFEVIGDPFQGALWSGPPFASSVWSAATGARAPESAAWLPRFGDGSFIRFTSQTNALPIPNAHWGPMRIVYLQYASDPITFFDYRTVYRQPDWMKSPRGPDVSPALQWYPAVTFLQLTLDVAMGTTAPMGHGHVYAPEHYIDAWLEVTGVQGWSTDDVARLKRKFRDGR